MRFSPKSEEQIQEESLCAVGKQPFTVMEANVVQSNSVKNKGKEMLKLNLNVHADDGMDYHIYDYVAPWFFAHKFRHFFFSLALGAAYEAGTVEPHDLVNREGYCDVGIQKAQKGYGPKNIITDYVMENSAKEAGSASELKAHPPEPEDDVPF